MGFEGFWGGLWLGVVDPSARRGTGFDDGRRWISTHVDNSEERYELIAF